MGRKGVSKRKKAKEKAASVSGSNSAASGRKADNQPEQVTEKAKAWPKDNKKH
jgi:hypothetical protein